ncbi:hypothetical protein L486_03387 [Kwoniella mangroviensis CBS 10435]|uniref:Chromosome segregation in meiosis protein n=1 Tax=Kwoniella mangroviensis CBS 10435 TaxID=1331196 RepID=A0A1B9ITZ3_9TREE|nr:hypothetical protein L486_03387 [Kwoniella mangroviensis CBS 10435]
MSGLEDLFNSPTRPPPPRSPIRSRSITPDNLPIRSNENPLFFSPGAPSEYDIDVGSPSRQRNVSPPGGQNIRTTVDEGAAQVDDDVGRYRVHQQGDFEDPFAALNATNGQDDAEEAGGKRKRTVAKVDADRLTSDRGIPALCRAAKKFKVKGKGHETQDLKNLLNMYQMWAHGMFPKGDFQHTINRVEVICRSKRMESALKGYREAFYPPPRSPSPPPLSDRALTPPSASQEDDRSADPQGREPLFTSRPAVQEEDDLGPDLEEMMALEEMERDAQNQSQNQNQNNTPTSIATIGGRRVDDYDGPPPDLEEEDEWEGLYN